MKPNALYHSIDSATITISLLLAGIDTNASIGCLIHIDIRDRKLWIQYDGMETGVANDLIAAGVPKEDIVLAFHSEYMRQFTEFAVQ